MRLTGLALAAVASAAAAAQVHFSWHWHLHQPIYIPGQTVVQTEENDPFGYDVLDIFTSRSGPYTDWPVSAIQSAAQAGIPTCGAQVSFTGALQENLNALANSSLTSAFNTWQQRWQWAAENLKTPLGNPAVSLSAFPHHHALLPLMPEQLYITVQIQMHALMLSRNMGVAPTVPKYLFPAENAFAEWIIPAITAAGVQAVLVDNIHFDRAVQGYPFTYGENLFPPNPADQRNNASRVANWVQLDNVWAPSKVSAPFGYQPHYVEYTDPATGNVSRIIAVPGARYEGVEDGRGGYGALEYGDVFSQVAFANTDEAHPIFIIMAHDGDNYGGGTNSYYQNNFANMLSWLSSSSSNFACSTIDDYLTTYPPAEDDVIHVEPGSWSGANNGDPLFMKWNPNWFDPAYEPERNSLAVMVAGLNRLMTAQAIAPFSSLDNVLDGPAARSATPTDLAWHFALTAGASDYLYWPTVQQWNSDPAVGMNLAVQYADAVINGSSSGDKTPPTVFLPQRQYWNPGAFDWNPNVANPADFAISTAVYDVSGLTSVTLNTIFTAGITFPTDALKVYAAPGWQTQPMTETPLVGPLAPQTDPLPTYIASLFAANVTCGTCGGLISYYVSATDSAGNTASSPIQHVFVPTQSA